MTFLQKTHFKSIILPALALSLFAGTASVHAMDVDDDTPPHYEHSSAVAPKVSAVAPMSVSRTEPVESPSKKQAPPSNESLKIYNRAIALCNSKDRLKHFEAARLFTQLGDYKKSILQLSLIHSGLTTRAESNPECAYILGRMYFSGEHGLHRDYYQAFRYFKLAKGYEDSDALIKSSIKGFKEAPFFADNECEGNTAFDTAQAVIKYGKSRLEQELARTKNTPTPRSVFVPREVVQVMPIEGKEGVDAASLQTILNRNSALDEQINIVRYKLGDLKSRADNQYVNEEKEIMHLQSVLRELEKEKRDLEAQVEALIF